MTLDFLLIAFCLVLSSILVILWNLISAPKVEPNPESPAWFTHHQFWTRKAARAFIRFNLAKAENDTEAMKVALKEHELYTRRMKEVVPLEVRERWAQSLQAEVAAAIAEKEEVNGY